MRILLTNDDGIYADGLFALYQELKKIGTVTIVAPESERSSVGHGITLAYPLWVKKVKRKGSFFGHAISGTPADCVKLALGVILKKKPDVIVSGINLGPNDGYSVFYSGTVAAAREGALLGVPSVAVSLGTFVNPDYRFAAKIAAKVVKHVFKHHLPKGTFLNVNIPNKKPQAIKDVRFTRQGNVPIHIQFTKRKDPNLRSYYWLSGRLVGVEKSTDVDTYALLRDHVSITPIHCDLTDYDFLNVLKDQPF